MDQFQSHFTGCSEFVNGVNKFSLQFFYHKYTLFMLQSHITVTNLYFSLIVSVIFIFGELGTRIYLAFNTIVK